MVHMPVIYVPQSRFTESTPAFVPPLLRPLRAGVVLTLDWATLQLMEPAPAYVWVGLAIDSLLILGILESRDWLAFKGKYYFRSSLGLLIIGYIAICASPFIIARYASHNASTHGYTDVVQ